MQGLCQKDAVYIYIYIILLSIIFKVCSPHRHMDLVVEFVQYQSIVRYKPEKTHIMKTTATF